MYSPVISGVLSSYRSLFSGVPSCNLQLLSSPWTISSVSSIQPVVRLRYTPHPAPGPADEAVIGFTPLVSCLSGATALCCLLSNALKTTISHILSNFSCCFMQEHVSSAVVNLLLSTNVFRIVKSSLELKVVK